MIIMGKAISKLKKKVIKLAKRYAKDLLFWVYFPYIYSKHAKSPIKQDKVIFVEIREFEISANFRYMVDELKKNYDFDIQIIFLKENSVRWRTYMENCSKMIKQVATARCVFLADASNVLSSIKLRPETKIAQLWHGCGAFKKFGLSTADLIFGASRKDALRHPYYRNLSLVTISSPEVAWAYTEAMHLEDSPETIQAIGVSRTDIFFDEYYLEQCHSKVQKAVPTCRGKKVILYAPTFRGRVAKAQGPDELDIKHMKEELGDEYILLIKHHPLVKHLPRIPEECMDFAFDVTHTFLVNDLLPVADICISDYSSLIFEYSLFERPMVFFAPDIDEFNDWRGFYYDYDELTPGPIYDNTDELVDYIKHIETAFDKKCVSDFKYKFMRSCDGGSTQRILDFMFGDDLPGFSKESINTEKETLELTSKDISIIIPVYNALPELRNTLDSVVHQTYSMSRIEIVVIDDHSTDGSWETILEYEKKYPETFVVERLPENSGSPAKPRNMGIEKASSNYIFFLDSDDWLGKRAVEKMLDHAVEWDSDVLLVKMCGTGERLVPTSMFTHNQPSVDVFASKVFWSINPLKLFKRSYIREYNLRFSEDTMPEDIIFSIQAYMLGGRVSVASDYDYYHVTLRPGGGNIFSSAWDNLDENLIEFKRIFDFVENHSTFEQRNLAIMRRLFKLDIYEMFRSVIRQSPENQKDYYSRIVALAKPYYVPELYCYLPFEIRMVLDSALFHDFETLLKAVSLGDSLLEECEFKLKDGHIICDAKKLDLPTVCDVTKWVSFTTFVQDSLVGESGALLLKGYIHAHRALIGQNALTIQVVVKNRKDETKECLFPCEIIPYKKRESEGGVVLNWVAKLDLTYLCRKLKENEWISEKCRETRGDLYVRVSVDSFVKDKRIGKLSSVNSHPGFFETSKKNDEFKLIPYRTEFGNFSYRIKG